jgi:hypothetical protein
MVTRSRQSKSATVQSDWQQAQFINRDLTTEEQAACKGMDFSEAEAMDAMERLTQQNYKITFRLDDYHHCASCWLLPDKTHPDNAGKILTGRGSSAYKAFKQVYYKHAVLFSEIWPSDPSQADYPEIDD